MRMFLGFREPVRRIQSFDRLEMRLSYEEPLRRVIPPFQALRDLTFLPAQFFQAIFRLSGQLFAFVRVETQGIEPIPIVQAQ